MLQYLASISKFNKSLHVKALIHLFFSGMSAREKEQGFQDEKRLGRASALVWTFSLYLACSWGEEVGGWQTGLTTYHIFSNKKHIYSYDQNWYEPSYTLHNPKEKDSVKQFDYVHSKATSYADCFGGKQLEAVTSREIKKAGKKKKKKSGGCDVHGTLHRGGKQLEACHRTNKKARKNW